MAMQDIKAGDTGATVSEKIKSNDTDLQAQITTEATTRLNNDASLQTALNAEAVERAALLTSLNAEVTARSNYDAGLQTTKLDKDFSDFIVPPNLNGTDIIPINNSSGV